jgi:hypothetical protein
MWHPGVSAVGSLVSQSLALRRSPPAHIGCLGPLLLSPPPLRRPGPAPRGPGAGGVPGPLRPGGRVHGGGACRRFSHGAGAARSGADPVAGQAAAAAGGLQGGHAVRAPQRGGARVAAPCQTGQCSAVRRDWGTGAESGDPGYIGRDWWCRVGRQSPQLRRALVSLDLRLRRRRGAQGGMRLRCDQWREDGKQGVGTKALRRAV